MKKLLMTVMALSCFAFSSYGQKVEKQIIGKWCNPYTYESTGELKGFEFKKGGKCIAASFGVFLGLIPNLLPVLILAFWFIFFSVVLIINPHALRTVVTYICWMVTMIFATIFIIKSIPILLSTILVGAMVIFRHNKALKEIEEKEIKFIFKRG